MIAAQLQGEALRKCEPSSVLSNPCESSPRLELGTLSYWPSRNLSCRIVSCAEQDPPGYARPDCMKHEAKGTYSFVDSEMGCNSQSDVGFSVDAGGTPAKP